VVVELVDHFAHVAENTGTVFPVQPRDLDQAFVEDGGHLFGGLLVELVLNGVEFFLHGREGTVLGVQEEGDEAVGVVLLPEVLGDFEFLDLMELPQQFLFLDREEGVGLGHVVPDHALEVLAFAQYYFGF